MSLFGVLLMLVAEFAEAGRLVMTQTLLTNLKFHPIEGCVRARQRLRSAGGGKWEEKEDEGREAY